jgi:DNA-binding response OmpR family regulator
MDTTRMTSSAPSPPAVLVAERDAGYAYELGSAFSAAGFMVRSAADGQEALETVEREILDLAVIDLDLPGIPGAAVIAALRRNRDTHRLPVLGLCSLSFREAREAIGLGADDCLIKPVAPEEVVDAALVVLDRSLQWQPDPAHLIAA